MKPSPILLDTCALLWIANGGLKPEAEAAIAENDAAGVPVVASPISAWEIGLLASRGRIALPIDPGRWFSGFIEEGIKLAPLTPQILVDSSFLPSADLRDPADRILAATARAFGYRLMTRDQPLLDYAAAGHLRAIGC